MLRSNPQRKPQKSQPNRPLLRLCNLTLLRIRLAKNRTLPLFNRMSKLIGRHRLKPQLMFRAVKWLNRQDNKNNRFWGITIYQFHNVILCHLTKLIKTPIVNLLFINHLQFNLAWLSKILLLMTMLRWDYKRMEVPQLKMDPSLVLHLHWDIPRLLNLVNYKNQLFTKEIQFTWVPSWIFLEGDPF